MTNFEFIKNMSIEELAQFLDCYGRFDDTPWLRWFNETYCENCEAVIAKYEDSIFGPGHEAEFAYCELSDESGIKRCRFFPNIDDVPNSKETCLMWLTEEKK